MRVTMTDNRRSEDGLSVLADGSTYTVSTAFGALLVQNGWATDIDRVLDAGGGVIVSQQAAALQFVPIASADIAGTTGITGQSYQVSDGDDEGAKLIWTSTAANPTASWRWWLWPDAEYL